MGYSIDADSRSQKASNKRARNFWPRGVSKVAPRRDGPMDARDIESDPCASSFSTVRLCQGSTSLAVAAVVTIVALASRLA